MFDHPTLRAITDLAPWCVKRREWQVAQANSGRLSQQMLLPNLQDLHQEILQGCLIAAHGQALIASAG